MPVKPKTLVYLRPDSIGDLILFTPALQLFMQEWPDARHVIVVRKGYEDLAPLFPARLEWLVAGFNPFRQRPAECAGALKALLDAVTAVGPDLILAPTLNRTWLEVAVAAHFRGTRSVVLGDAGVDPIFAATVKLDLGVEVVGAFGETIASQPSAGDVENQHRFAEQVIGRALDRKAPAVEVPSAARASARAWASDHGLPAGKWAAVFAGGLANVVVKAWTTEKFAEVVVDLQARSGLPVLVMGHVSETGIIEEVAAKVAGLGAPQPATWLGRDGELPLLAGLLADARLYVGHDTGALHLAGAVGRPVVGIFGGGHWPRFRPSALQAVSVVQPLPCFGCNWDCHFGNGPCAKLIPAADVAAAIDRLLAAEDAPLNIVLESHPMAAESVALIAAALPGIQALKQARVDRQHKIEELKAETDSKDVEITALKSAAEERKVEMESIKAELEQECADKDQEITELKAETNSKDTEIAELKVTCDDREQIVMRLDKGLKDHIEASAARDAQVAALQADRDRLAQSLELLGTFPPDAEIWAQAIRDKDVHIANLDTIIAGLRSEISNYASGYGGVEQAKHYGQLLAAKEAVIQELHKSCVERGAVIAELAAEATTPTAKLRKLWIGFAAFLRARIARPIGAKVFRKVVENYWMQIGVLRHYEGRPIAWDRRLPAGKPDRPDLPKIGIVTPSYGQDAFVESTILSILNQNYPKLIYVVQDGGSKDSSPTIIAKYDSRLHHWSSEKDRGQADAIRKGFTHIEPELAPTDVMAWFNSDDLVAPKVLAFVAGYFADHPEVDVIYGHRIIIDEHDQEVGRWIMPPHEADSIEWIDYVPQETMFWRKRAWDIAGGIDPNFQFALDWDLLARFHQAGYKIVRVPYFLGCFRVHSQQKTNQAIHTVGAVEMAKIRTRFHGADKDNVAMIERHARRIRFRGAVTARLLGAGLRW